MTSSARSINHGSFTIDRKLDIDPAVVFRAWTDPAVKARWFSGPADKWTETLREMDVRVGGRERLVGQFSEGSESRFDAVYIDVVPDRRLVYSYEMHWQGKKISVSLASIEFVAAGRGTKLIVTEQGAFLDGFDDGGSRERGTESLLDNLVRVVSGR